MKECIFVCKKMNFKRRNDDIDASDFEPTRKIAKLSLEESAKEVENEQHLEQIDDLLKKTNMDIRLLYIMDQWNDILQIQEHLLSKTE